MKAVSKLRLWSATLAFVCCFAPLFVAVDTVGGGRVEDIPKAARAELDELTNESGQRLDDWYGSIRVQLRTISESPDLMVNPVQEIRQELKAHADAMPWARVIFVTRPDGWQVARTDAESFIDTTNRPYTKPALTRGVAQMVSVSQTTGGSTFYVALPLTARSGGAGGIVCAAVDLDKVSSVLLGAVEKARPGAQEFVVQEDGKLLAHSRPGAVAQPKRGELALAVDHPLWKDRPRAGLLEVARYADKDGKQWIGAMRRTSLGWYAAVEVPAESFGSIEQSARGTLLMGALGAALLAAALAWFGAGWAARARPGARGRAAMAAMAALAVGAPGAGFVAWERDALGSAAREEATRVVESAAQRSARKMGTWMEGNQIAVAALAAAPNLAADGASDDPGRKERAKARLRLGIARMPWVRASFMTNLEGWQVARSDEERMPFNADRQFFKEARVGAFGHLVGVSRVTRKPTLVVARAIKGEGGAFMGIVGLATDMEAVGAQVVNERVGGSGWRFLLDEKAALMAHFDPAKRALGSDGELPSYAAHPMWSARPVSGSVASKDFSWEGAHALGAIARAGRFYVVAAIPIAEVEAVARDEAEEAARAVAVGALLAALCAGMAFGGRRPEAA